MNVDDLAGGGIGGALVAGVFTLINKLLKRSTDAEAMVRAILKHQAEECEARYRALIAAVDARLNEVDRRLDTERPPALPDMSEEVVHGE